MDYIIKNIPTEYYNRVIKKDKILADSGGIGTEEAVEHALQWLCRHQKTNGGWGSASFVSNCVEEGTKCSGQGSEEFSVGCSSLALLAFLGRGYTHLSRDSYDDEIINKTFKYGEVVKKAIWYLIAQQDGEGCIGKQGAKYMYNHAIATLALAEAYGMTSEKQFEEPARKAVNYIIEAQNRGAGGGDYDRRGWRYTYRSGESDASVTGWCVMALKSADMSGLFSGHGSAAFGGAIGWVKEVTDDANDYRVGYMAKASGKVCMRGINDAWSDHDALTAIGMLTRIFINKDKNDPALAGGANRLMMEQNIPNYFDNSQGEKQIDYYHWYYSTLALFQYDGPDGPKWEKWNESMKTALLPYQHSTNYSCLYGSWDPEVDRWGFEGGRVYATAINALTLEVYYRYQNIFKMKKPDRTMTVPQKAFAEEKQKNSNSGENKDKCAKCNGSGEITCPGCSGRGYTDLSETCHRCQGAGNIVGAGSELKCLKCDGSGTITTRTWCKSCDKTGKMTCPKCKGSGILQQ